MIGVTDIPWTPFTDLFDPLEGIEPGDVHGAIVRLLRILHAKNELLAVSMAMLKAGEADGAALRRQNIHLIEELRQIRKKVAA